MILLHNRVYKVFNKYYYEIRCLRTLNVFRMEFAIQEPYSVEWSYYKLRIPE